MTICRATLILPCHRPDDFPTHLTGDRAAELLHGWTALWHPSLLAEIGAIPGWRASDELPDPSEFEGELLVLPESSRQRMSADWSDRLRSTNPDNPSPVEVLGSRRETIDAILARAGIDGTQVRAEAVGDFLALGFAYLQVELLTRAMRYTTVLDAEHFAEATLSAARAAVAGSEHDMREDLARAFDLLADARNHVYAVDFFVVDMTLIVPSTLGSGLREKLARGNPTSLLASGELLDQIASDHPETMDELRRAVGAGTACVVGGTLRSRVSSFACPEEWLDEIKLGNAAAQRHLQRDYSVFGMFHTAFSPVLPELLAGMGFCGALHSSFDGGRLPRTEQCKTWWGPAEGHTIAALATTPLDAARPETWLKLAEKIGDTIAHDHVATILLASWPEIDIEYFEDLQRAARYGPVLGKLVTLEEYFRTSREPDEWTRFHTREYPARQGTELGPNPISTIVDGYRRGVLETHERLSEGLAAVVELKRLQPDGNPAHEIVLNAWNFPCTQLTGADPADLNWALSSGATDTNSPTGSPRCLPDVPGCGFATYAAAAPTASVALAEGNMLRNERLQVTVSEATGGIQSLRAYRDRNTRLSQRLVFHRGRYASTQDSQMVAERVEVTRNDALIGEIVSRGRLLDSSDEVLASFVQRVRIVRGMPAVFVDVELEPQRMPEGDIWRSYYASRLAWTDEAIRVSRGGHWMGHETGRERIESPEWIQVDDGIGSITCFGLGLPYHRRSSGQWLDTLLIVGGEERRRFQFALSLDENYPLRAGLGLLTAGQAPVMTMPAAPPVSRGWFVHVGANNIVATHIEPLANPRTGIRIRLLETEGRETQTTLDAFRGFRAAQTTDFRGNSTGVLSMVDGRVEFDIGAHRWIQIEAEW